MSFRPTHYPCSNEDAHEAHQHTDGPDNYYYMCPGREPCRITPDGWCATHSTADGPVYHDADAR